MASEDLTMNGSMGFNSGLNQLMGLGQAQMNTYNSQANSCQNAGDYHALVRAQQEAQIRAQELYLVTAEVQAAKSNDDRLIVLLTEE